MQSWHLNPGVFAVTVLAPLRTSGPSAPYPGGKMKTRDALCTCTGLSGQSWEQARRAYWSTYCVLLVGAGMGPVLSARAQETETCEAHWG